MTTTAAPPRYQDLFRLRVAIARLGESDAFSWWNSYALTEAGEYALPRVFGRSPRLAAAHLALMAARIRHDQGVPKEPVVHLFNFGEAVEGGFERWLIEQKSEGREIEIPSKPSVSSAVAALKELGIEPAEVQADTDRVALGTIRASDLENPVARQRAAARLTGAYSASDHGRLVVPYFRVER